MTGLAPVLPPILEPGSPPKAMNCQPGKPNGSAWPGGVRPFQRCFSGPCQALPETIAPVERDPTPAAAPRRRPKGKSTRRKPGRPRAALPYALASAALATAFAAGPTVMLTGTAAQAASVPACPTHHVDCMKKPQCC